MDFIAIMLDLIRNAIVIVVKTIDEKNIHFITAIVKVTITTTSRMKKISFTQTPKTLTFEEFILFYQDRKN